MDSPLWEYHIPVSNDIAEQFVGGEDRRVKCTLNEEVITHTALMPKDGQFYILVNREIRNRLGLKLGDEITVKLEKDTSTYGMPMPEELAVMLGQDEEANRLFHLLTPGKQRSLIYIVSKVKSTQSRINKALGIVDHLKMAAGQLDFKLLNERIKFYNQRGRK